MDDDRIRITYELAGRDPAALEARVSDIAREQTVELPPGGAPTAVDARMVGRIESIEPVGTDCWHAAVTYDAELAGGIASQLLNLVYGNVSFQPGVEIVDVELPASRLSRFGGPRFGLSAVRAAHPEASGRPLLVSASKPIGLRVQELAERCGALARGGIDVVKDDHGVMDQPWAPFAERVPRCADAVADANRRTGGTTWYVPNVTGPLEGLDARLAVARDAGCRAVLVSPFLMGLEALVALAARREFVLVAHPAFGGALVQPRRGIRTHVLLGRLLRLFGADAVIFIAPGGRFPVSEDETMSLVDTLRDPWGSLRPALPVAGGGVRPETVGTWVKRYGVETAFLVGGGLYVQSDLERAARDLRTAVEEAIRG